MTSFLYACSFEIIFDMILCIYDIIVCTVMQMASGIKVLVLTKLSWKLFKVELDNGYWHTYFRFVWCFTGCLGGWLNAGISVQLMYEDLFARNMY